MTISEINTIADNVKIMILDGAEILYNRITQDFRREKYFTFSVKQRTAIQSAINYLRLRAENRTVYSWGMVDFQFVEASQVKYLQRENKKRLDDYKLKRDEYLRNHKAI